MVINKLQNQTERREINNVDKTYIFSDSQCAIGHLTLEWEAKTHKASLQEIKSSIQMLESARIIVDISWTLGHSNILGYEYVDQMAKEAAEEAKEMTDCHQLSQWEM